MKRRVLLRAAGLTWAAGIPSAWSQPRRSQGDVTPEDFGARGDGRGDDSGALAEGLAAVAARGGGTLWLSSGRTYRLATQLVVPSHCGIAGDGSATLYAPADHFDNTDSRVRDATRAAIVSLSGQASPPYLPALGPFLQGVRIRSEVRQGRFVNGIVARNVQDLRIEGCDISGLPMGMAIRAASLSGRSVIHGNHIHDCTDDSVLPGGAVPQITAIEIDNDRVDGRPSVGFRITGNRIADITVGPAFAAAHGWQTDGIHIHQRASGFVVAQNIISNVGEGIDLYGSDGLVSDNVLTDCRLYGIKLIHGARFNRVGGNLVRRAGKAGITAWGSTLPGAGHTEMNLFAGNMVGDINPEGVFTADDTACLLTGGSGYPWKARENRFSGNLLDPGPRCGWAINPAADGAGNTFEDNTVVSQGVLGRMRRRG